jgi:hypothetical protein
MMAKFPEDAQAMRTAFDDGYIDFVSARRSIFLFPNLYLFDAKGKHREREERACEPRSRERKANTVSARSELASPAVASERQTP